MTKKQKITHWENKINEIVEDYQALTAACNAAEKAGCLDPNGPLFTALWNVFGNLLRRADYDGWVNWHIYDNDCGKKAREVIIDGTPRKIRTPRQLAELIVDLETN